MSLTLHRFHLLLLLIAATLLGACGAVQPAPAIQTPTLRPGPGTATAIDSPPASSDQQDIVTLVAAMQEAVVRGDKDAYLSHVDLADPIFALEHTRWADGWSKQPPATFALEVRDMTFTGSSATGALTLRWKMETGQAEVDELGERTAKLPVRFNRGADGRWRYAGEAWVSYETEHFKLRVLPGLEDVATELIPELPEVYAHVTGGLGYKPTRDPEIKIYDSSPCLVAATLLSLPNVRGWNEPGEALKFRAAQYEPALKGGLAHEFTHYLTFDMAGTAHSRMPWWLDEGLAAYVGSRFDPPERAEDRMSQVREWAAEEGLADWDSISDFDTTPLERWQYVYPQGYAMVRYITERFGSERRNRWVAAMATDMEIEQATSEILGLPFEELDRAFEAWAKEQ